MRLLAIGLLLSACASPATPAKKAPTVEQRPLPVRDVIVDAGVDADIDATDDASATAMPPRDPCALSEERAWHLRLEPRAPASTHRGALLANVSLPGRFVCARDGSLFLELTTAEARALLGEHASFQGTSGAGNATDACGWYASLQPASFLPAALADDVAKLRFDTDPKLEIVRELAPCRR